MIQIHLFTLLKVNFEYSQTLKPANLADQALPIRALNTVLHLSVVLNIGETT